MCGERESEGEGKRQRKRQRQKQGQRRTGRQPDGRHPSSPSEMASIAAHCLSLAADEYPKLPRLLFSLAPPNALLESSSRSIQSSGLPAINPLTLQLSNALAAAHFGSIADLCIPLGLPSLEGERGFNNSSGHWLLVTFSCALRCWPLQSGHPSASRGCFRTPLSDAVWALHVFCGTAQVCAILGH